jgi:hypothetical protein
MADPEEYRTKEQVEEWRKRDPIETFGGRLTSEGVMSEDEWKEFDDESVGIVNEAVKFADESPFPDLDSLYDDVYVLGEQVRAWYTVDERSPDVHPGEGERDASDLAHRLAEAGAAYAHVDTKKQEEDAEEEDS